MARILIELSEAAAEALFVVTRKIGGQERGPRGTFDVLGSQLTRLLARGYEKGTFGPDAGLISDRIRKDWAAKGIKDSGSIQFDVAEAPINGFKDVVVREKAV